MGLAAGPLRGRRRPRRLSGCRRGLGFGGLGSRRGGARSSRRRFLISGYCSRRKESAEVRKELLIATTKKATALSAVTESKPPAFSSLNTRTKETKRGGGCRVGRLYNSRRLLNIDRWRSLSARNAAAHHLRSRESIDLFRIIP